MELSIWLEVVNLPAIGEDNVCGIKVHWRNPPNISGAIYATKAWKGEEEEPSEKDLVRLATEGLKDLFAHQYGMETEWPREIQSWWCIYRVHQHYIERTIVDAARNALYTSL